MDIAHLRYFLALCQEQNYTSAAEKCFITRQAMKQSVAVLEKFYGTELVHNEKNKLSITPQGKLLEKSAVKIVTELDHVEVELFEEALSQHPLQVGVSRSLVPFYAPNVLKKLDHEDHVQTHGGTQEELLRMVASGELDCALVVDDGRIESGNISDASHPQEHGVKQQEVLLRRVVLKENAMMLLLNKKDPLARLDQIRVEDLQDYDLQIMSDPMDAFSCFGNLRDALKEAGVKVHWHVTPDYHTANYHAMEDKWPGIDRDGADFEEYSVDMLTEKPFADESFRMYLSLVSLKTANPGVRLLERKLRKVSTKE